MKVAIYAPYTLWTPHFETDLELAQIHLDRGDDVHLILCDAKGFPCDQNPDMRKSKCLVCQSRAAAGIQRLQAAKGRLFTHSIPVDIDNQKGPSASKFTSLTELLKWKHGDYSAGKAVASTLISVTRDPNPDLSLHQDWVSTALRSSCQVFDSAVRLLSTIGPEKLILFNGRFILHQPVLDAARALKIPFSTHERGANRDLYEEFEGSIPHDLESTKRSILEYWNQAGGGQDREGVAKSWYTGRRGGQEQSWYSFTTAQKAGKLPKGFDQREINLVIFNSSEDEMATFPEWRNPIYGNQQTALDRILPDLSDKNLRIWLRVHPNLKGLKNEQTRHLANLRSPNLTVIGAEDNIDTYALIDAATTILTFSSTVGVEAAFWGKSTILAGRAFYEHLECCHRPVDHNEVIRMILDQPRALPNEGAIKYGYWAATYGRPFKYFQAQSLGEGLFKGKRIHPSLQSRLLHRIDRLLHPGR